MTKTLNKFTKYGKVYKLDVGDVFFTNGACFNFRPKDESKLPFKGWSRVNLSPNQDIAEAIKNGVFSNIEVLRKENQEKMELIWYKVTSVNIEKRDEVELTEKELYSMELNIGYSNKEHFEITFEKSNIKRETDKMYYLEKDLNYLSQYSKDTIMKITEKYSSYRVVYDDIEKYSEVEDMLINRAQKDLDNQVAQLNKKLEKLNFLKEVKGL